MMSAAHVAIRVTPPRVKAKPPGPRPFFLCPPVLWEGFLSMALDSVVGGLLTLCPTVTFSSGKSHGGSFPPALRLFPSNLNANQEAKSSVNNMVWQL